MSETFPWALVNSDLARLDPRTIALMCAVIGVLALSTVVGQILKRQPESMINAALLETFQRRVWSWWVMCVILVACFLIGRLMTVLLFFFVSFWALREYITMTPTRRGDHRALFWTFFIFTPLQYLFVAIGRTFADRNHEELIFGWLAGYDFYGVYSILIPVYASAFIPARIALSGDPKRFLERSAKIQAGLLICVYSLSYAPALLDLPLTRSRSTDRWQGSTEGVLFYFILIVQLGDVFQYAWSKLGRRVIAPTINASRTWEGFLGGVASTTVAGALLWWATPFSMWEAAGMSFATAVMGFAGAMVMSAIKRDRGVQDYGTLVQGHAGVLDRIDSICFAAPIFFHLTRLFYTNL